MTTTTRSVLMSRIAPHLGGYSGSITSGTGTTVVLGGLVGVLNDDELNDWLLIMPDAATAADQQRIVTDFTGSTGTATIGTRSDTTYTSETYILVPKNTYTLQEIRDMISKAMRETKRTYRYALPTWNDERQYPLAALSWLRNAKDVDGVQYRPSPCLIDNEDFSRRHSGITSAPDSWTLAGSGATVGYQSTYASHGAYEVTLTRVTNDATLTQNVLYPLAKQLIDGLATVSFKVRCTASVASRVRVGVNNGTDTTWSDYHSGDGEPEDLTVSRTLTAAASRIQFVLSVDSGDTTGSFDLAIPVEGSSVDDSLWAAGSDGYALTDVDYQMHNIGSAVPILSLPRAYGRGGQLVVVSRRPFADFSADSDSTEAPSDMLEARTLWELASLQKPGQDRARLDRLLAVYGPLFAEYASGLIDKPVLKAQQPRYVIGA